MDAASLLDHAQQLQAQGLEAEAEAAWRALAESVPGTLLAAEAYNNLGILLDRQRRYGESAHAYQQALALVPEDASVLTNFGVLLAHCGDMDAAEEVQRLALQCEPTSASAHANLADVLVASGRYAEGEAHYVKVIELDGAAVTARVNLGILLTDLGRFDEAEHALRAALAIAPTACAAHTSLAQLLLCQGRLEEGFACFEQRRTVAEFAQFFAADPARSACRYWQGEPLAGKSILILPEQGFGDEIQFARYLRWLKTQGARHITQICRDEQLSLMRILDGADLVIGLSEAAQHCEPYDYWTLLMSLPHIAQTTLASIPASIPYLHADPERVARWAARLPTSGRRVGIVWQGNPAHSNDAERSLPGPEVLAPLWNVAGLTFIGLRKAELVGDAALPLFDLGPQIGDFADTAAIIAQLDLLICVDTAVAHLAGALGVPCWVLLPAYKTDWRWLRERADSPWYPTMRLYRQPERGNWQAAVAALADDLARWQP